VPAPLRGEVWLVNLAPTRGREQAGTRPAVVVSDDILNAGPAEIVIVLPVTTTCRDIPLHVKVLPAKGGLRAVSFIMCDQIRTISKDRLTKRLGAVGGQTLAQIEDRLRVLLDL
jgi:mRNA interferase MazF